MNGKYKLISHYMLREPNAIWYICACIIITSVDALSHGTNRLDENNKTAPTQPDQTPNYTNFKWRKKKKKTTNFFEKTLTSSS